MTVIGFIGSGHIGGNVARLAVAAGYDVVLSNSRGPETLAALVDELGDRARAATAAEAAAAGDIVVVSVPFGAFDKMPVQPLAGKTVIDTNNYYPHRDGHFVELDHDEITSSEMLQRRLPTSHVVKVFNNITFKHLMQLVRPSGAADRSAFPIAGDNEEAKSAVTEFLDKIGYDAHDVGPLAEGWRYQNDTPAYDAYFGPQGENGDGRPVDVATLTDMLAAATRAKPSQ
jgi:8-hydroxy-5-deazaflavin:NADPH oxidoreductase